MTTMNWYACPDSWSLILRRYLPSLTLCSLLWELVQLPLYTIWVEARPGWIAFAVAHCTAGDILIGTMTLMVALILSRASEPANWPATRVGTLTVVLAVSYTLLSEWLNVDQGSWAYSSLMPVLPWIGVGLAPVMQWVIVPLVAFWWAIRHQRY